jgi:hypothetical protein
LATRLLKSSAVTANDINFWLNSMGSTFGIDENLCNVLNKTDLWVSVKDSIDNIDRINATSVSRSLCEAHQKLISNEFKTINQFQRAFIWGIMN